MTPATTLATTTQTQPDYFNMVRGELFKMRRLPALWIAGGILGALMTGIAFLNLYFEGQITLVQRNADGVVLQPGYLTYTLTQSALGNVRGFTGFFIMFVTVFIFALEYQQGTIRVLLSRGLGRMRLLLAKLGAIFVFGLIVLAAALVIHAILLVLSLQLNQGSLNDLSGLPDFYWSDTYAYIGTLVVNLAVNILFAATLATLGRSLALGLSVALPYFLVENIATGILTAVALGTGNKAWYDATGYFLGANLSALASQLIPARGFNFQGAGNGPTGVSGFPFDGTHAIVMTIVYAAVFLGVSLFLVRQRDVTQ